MLLKQTLVIPVMGHMERLGISLHFDSRMLEVCLESCCNSLFEVSSNTVLSIGMEHSWNCSIVCLQKLEPPAHYVIK